MEKQPEFRILWVVLLLLLLVTRIPLMAEYFSIDNVNLAFSLEKFNPGIHQPQPPGYPLFVAFAKLLHLFLNNAWRTFAAISILASALSLWLAFLIGNRMFSPWAGAMGTCLLLMNPVFWLAGIEGPLRPNLALFSLLTGYCCWRCWNGEKRFALWGAIALGVGGGFRPDLLGYLLPLWLVSSWVGTRSWRSVLSAAAVLCAIVAAWTSATILAMGGFRVYRDIMYAYAVDWSRASSAIPGASILEWLRQKNRLFLWNGLAVIGWIWTAPIYFFRRKTSPLGAGRFAFFALWILPGIILQALTHYDAPGHLLFSISALCVFGGYMLSLLPLRNVVTEAVLILNAMMFFNCFGMPKTTRKSDMPSMKNALQVGIYECSNAWLRNMDSIVRNTLSEIERYTVPDRPTVIVTTDSFVDRWFMNWRIGRYYSPNHYFWVLCETSGKKRVEQHIRNRRVGFKFFPLTIPVPNNGRILWLLEPGSRVLGELAKSFPLKGGNSVYYTDITPDSPPILLDGFEIVPSQTDKK
jgi:hypothetical protein